MDISEWVRGLLQNWVAQLIAWVVIVGGSAMLAWAKSKEWRYVQPTFYGIMTFAMLATAFVVITRIPQMPKDIAGHIKGTAGEVTPQEIQVKVRSWLDVTGYSITTAKTAPSYYFNYEVMAKGYGFNVFSPKGEKKIIGFTTTMRLAKDSLDHLRRLKLGQQDIVLATLKTELIKYKIQYHDLMPPLDKVQLTHVLPYDDTLTERVFYDALFHFEGSMLLFAQVLTRELNLFRR